MSGHLHYYWIVGDQMDIITIPVTTALFA